MQLTPDVSFICLQSLEDLVSIDSTTFSGSNGEALDRNFGIWPLETINAGIDLRITGDFVGSALFEVKTAEKIRKIFTLSVVRSYKGIHLQAIPAKLTVSHSLKNDDISHEVRLI